VKLYEPAVSRTVDRTNAWCDDNPAVEDLIARVSSSGRRTRDVTDAELRAAGVTRATYAALAVQEAWLGHLDGRYGVASHSAGLISRLALDRTPRVRERGPQRRPRARRPRRVAATRGSPDRPRLVRVA
jgi:hypothetical protein